MYRLVPALAALLTLGTVSAQSLQPDRRVAITIDDGPVVNEMSDLGRFQRITNGLIGAFQFTGPGGSWLNRSAAATGKRIESTTSPRVPAWVTTPPATP